MSSKHVSAKEVQKVFTLQQEIRIVLIGKTGVGKSETGNSIIGKDVFKSEDFGDSVTQVCNMKEAIRDGKKIVVVDTPGLFDHKENVENTKNEVTKCVGILAPGVHCFLLIVQSGRFSEEDKQTLDQILQMFGENVHRYAIVLITKVDHLKGKDSDEEKYRKYQDHFPVILGEYLKKINQRCIWINNTADEEKREAQVSRLLEMIQENVKANGGTCYTNAMFEKMDQKIREEIEKMRAEEQKKDREEREKARQKMEEELREQHKKHMEEMRKQIKEQQENARKRQEEDQKRQEEERKRQDREKGEKARQRMEEELREQHKREMDEIRRKMREQQERERKRQKEEAERQEEEYKRQEEEYKRKEEDCRRQEEDYRRKIREDFQKGDRSFLDKFKDVVKGFLSRFLPF